MSYAAAAALQGAIFAHLSSAPALSGVEICDALPQGALGTFVLLGAEEVRDAGDKTGPGARHRIEISVISDAAGFSTAKAIAVAISDRLAEALPPLTRGRLVQIGFERARARRLDEGKTRRIDLTFQARIEISP